MAGGDAFPAQMQGAVGENLWNATTDGSDAACLAAYGPGSPEAWHCFFAQYLMPFQKVDTFIINSQYDAASMFGILQPGCSLVRVKWVRKGRLLSSA